ncbi:MAG TPA: hypothetical protein VMF86_08570 [Stellaceae bacterium]|nr:hypothetical protein [Stellaceae bacterium]
MTPAVRELAATREDAWDRVVETTSDGEFFHGAGWRRVIEAALRQKDAVRGLQ